MGDSSGGSARAPPGLPRSLLATSYSSTTSSLDGSAMTSLPASACPSSCFLIPSLYSATSAADGSLEKLSRLLLLPNRNDGTSEDETDRAEPRCREEAPVAALPDEPALPDDWVLDRAGGGGPSLASSAEPRPPSSSGLWSSTSSSTSVPMCSTVCVVVIFVDMQNKEGNGRSNASELSSPTTTKQQHSKREVRNNSPSSSGLAMPPATSVAPPPAKPGPSRSISSPDADDTELSVSDEESDDEAGTTSQKSPLMLGVRREGPGLEGGGGAAGCRAGSAASTRRVTPSVRPAPAVSLIRLTAAWNPPGREANCTPFTVFWIEGNERREGFIFALYLSLSRKKHSLVPCTLTRRYDVAHHQGRVARHPPPPLRDEHAGAVLGRLDLDAEGAPGDGERDRFDGRHGPISFVSCLFLFSHEEMSRDSRVVFLDVEVLVFLLGSFAVSISTNNYTCECSKI